MKDYEKLVLLLEKVRSSTERNGDSLAYLYYILVGLVVFLSIVYLYEKKKKNEMKIEGFENTISDLEKTIAKTKMKPISNTLGNRPSTLN